MKTLLVWETLSLISGGQRMTLMVMDLLRDQYAFHCLIPARGELSKALDQRGIPYTLMGDQTLPIGVKGKRAIFRYVWLSMRAIFRALRVIVSIKPDGLYAPGPAALPWSAVCGMLTRRPVVWHLHHIFFDKPTVRLLNWFSSWRAVGRIVAVSDAVGSQITQPSAQEKRLTLYNPVDSAVMSAGDGQRFLDRLKLDKTDRLLIGQVALLQPTKRQDTVVETAIRLKERGRDVGVLLAGRARPEDADYECALRERVAQAGMEENVLFIGQRDDIPDMLQATDVLMIPSVEGLSLTGLEAAAAGCPVLAANTGGAQELIQISGVGQCFRYDDADDAADHVLSIMERRDQYARAGQAFVAGCTEKRYAADIATVFNEML